MDVNFLIRQEEFFNTDCVAINSQKIVGYNLIENRIYLVADLAIDEADLTNIFQNFSVEIDGSNYVGGKASAHGSCGFFYKRTGDCLNWALMSTESDPFIKVEVQGKNVRFLSSSGFNWIVPNDDIANVYVEK